MGAHNIEFDMVGAPSFSAIEKKFKEIREENRDYNGHQEGYSGDFQTVHAVKDHTHKTFDSYNEAHKYCLDVAQKWDFVVAVRYRFLPKDGFKYSAKYEKLKTKFEALNLQLQTLENKPAKLTKAFVTCEGCRSKISTKHLGEVGHRQRTTCPVCNEGDFRPLSVLRSITKVKAKIELAQKVLEALKKSEREKGLKKAGKVGTLVAGWGAS